MSLNSYPSPMPAIYPFNAIRYAQAGDVSGLVAPPYDVLDDAAKTLLLARDPCNIVGIDLPHTPPKELGPPEAYSGAADRYRRMLSDRVLAPTAGPVMFAYRQTWIQSDPDRPGASKSMSRSGLACCVEAVPFGARPGGGILPHEETFSGPKADRLALMRATRAQLSPIFGLHADQGGKATSLLVRVAASRPPDQTARTADGTLHEAWSISDPPTIAEFEKALAGEDIFIADGHHRYNTALNYLHELEAHATVAAAHPARHTMMVLVGMSDPGLVIWPTHRVLGGMNGYSYAKFIAAVAAHVDIQPLPGGSIRDLMEALAAANHATRQGRHLFGLFDLATRQAALASPTTEDPLQSRFPDRTRAWRDLSVAFIQHILVEQVCQPTLNAGHPVKWSFPHTVDEAEAAGREKDAQLAVLVQPTPLSAVREVSQAGQLMPQKSTFFYPKLVTGMFIHPLE